MRTKVHVERTREPTVDIMSFSEMFLAPVLVVALLCLFAAILPFAAIAGRSSFLGMAFAPSPISISSASESGSDTESHESSPVKITARQNTGEYV